MLHYRKLAWPLMLLIGFCCSALADDDVQTRIERAREAFATETRSIQADVLLEIEAKEAAERKRTKPDIEKIKNFKTNREQLEEAGTIPDWISTKLKNRIKKNTATLISALSMARSEALRNKDDKTAGELDEEIGKLKGDAKSASDKPVGAERPVAGKGPGSAKALPKGTKPGVKAKVWPRNAPALAIAPFSAEEARGHQQAWAKYLKVEPEFTNRLGMKFVLIPPGEFAMGTTPEELEEVLKLPFDAPQKNGFLSEVPQHVVRLNYPFYLGMHEVTQKQYEQVMGTNPAHHSPTGNGSAKVDKPGDHPIENVSWLDAAEFCSRLSVNDKRLPFYNRQDDKVEFLNGNGYRLPTEAEWEFADRAGTTTRYWCGDSEEELKAAEAGWFRTNRTQPVGTRKANPFGLYDMVGNVREMVDDFYDATWYARFKDAPAIDPRCPQLTTGDHVVRGGYFGDDPATCRSAARMSRAATNRGYDIGFRVVLAINPK